MDNRPVLATLRRLYHHLHNGGTWSDLDTHTLSRAISTIEELSEGKCRFNCRTAKDNFIAGWHTGADDPDSFRENADMEAWKEYQQEEYTLESEIGFIKETPNEL